MLIYSNCSSRELSKIVKKHGRNFVFLHHTGNMLGMGCPVSDKDSISRILNQKGREKGKGFITLIPDLSWLQFNDTIRKKTGLKNSTPISVSITSKILYLLEQYWPGNLTVILTLKDSHDHEHLSINDRIALRVPTSKCLRSFIKKIGEPVTSTSINVTGHSPIESLSEINDPEWFDFAFLPSDEINKPSHNSTIISLEGGKPVLLRGGSIHFDDIEESYQSPLILFVCTGNICRSPMAEYYARHLISEQGLPYRIASAGVMAGGFPISTNSLELLKKDNINAKNHISQIVDYKLLEKTWLVLTMEENHKDYLQERFPIFSHKFFTLAEFSGDKGDVDDPYMGSLEQYLDTYQYIKRYLSILMEKLQLRVEIPITLQLLKNI